MEEFPQLKEKLRIVVFCGGYGTRMWPMSRQNFPKQFQPLLQEHSFFQEALTRIKLSFKTEDIFISTPEEQVKFVKKQAKGIPFKNIIAEPERRDTLGAVAFTTAFIDKHFPNSLMAIIWGADHIVKKKEEFNHLLNLAARVCQSKDVICKIDVKPTYPSTANGWIKVGREIGRVEGHPIKEFIKHIEKPKLGEAQKMFTAKDFLLNTGYFVFRTSTMLNLLQKYSLPCYEHLKVIQAAFGKPQGEEIIKREYHQIEKTSIDYGLSEKLPSGTQLVIAADIGWYDVGTWDLLYEALAIGQRQNITRGTIEFMQAKGNLVYLPKRKIAAIIGIDNLVVVDTKDGLLVYRRGQGGEVKKFVEFLKKTGKKEYL